MDIESKLFLNEKVENQDRKFGSALEYQPLYVVMADGSEVPAMFTIDAIEEAIERAARNPEDMPEKEGKSFFERLFVG
jgi:aconitase A